MNVNLDLLRCFQTPTTIYEISKCGMWSAYSGAYKQVKKLLAQELIFLASIQTTEKNALRKKYGLTEKGRQLLKVFSKDAKEASF